MAATFLKPAPQSGDGEWLIQNGPSKRAPRRRRKKPEVPSFLFQAADHKYDAGDEAEVEPKQASFLRPVCDIRKEQASHEEGDGACKHEPLTMGSEKPLSPTMQNSTQGTTPAAHTPRSTTDRAKTNRSQDSTALSTSKNSLTISDSMALPPHLRPRKAPTTSQTSKDTPTCDPVQTNETATSDTMPPKRSTRSNTKANAINTNVQSISNLLTPPPEEPNGIAIREKLMQEHRVLKDKHEKLRQDHEVMNDIREKLKQDHGVMVEDPKPATESPKSLGPHPDSNEDKGRQTNGAFSKPTRRNTRAAPKAIPAHAHGERAQEDRLHQPSKRGGRNASRGRGNVTAARAPLAPRTSRWPANAETRPDPHRCDPKWEEESRKDSIDSARADSGFGDKKNKRKDIDSETGFKLTGWDGDWAPAPVNWDARPAFRDHQSAEKIEHWMKAIEDAMGSSGLREAVPIPMDELTAATGEYGEIAPRYWVPIVIGKQAPQTFWNELIRSDKPSPEHEGDLDGALPWWELYDLKDGNLLKPRERPTLKGVDPDENQHERLARENDHGSNKHTENRKRLEKAKRDAEREKRKRAQEKSRKLSKQLSRGENREPIKPGMKIYLRSARPEDMKAIRALYNYYVHNSVATPEMQPRTLEDINQRYNEIVRNKLPFLVACQRGDVIKGRRKKNAGEEIILPETIVGFATADDYNDILGMYRFTAEIEVFVDKDHYMKGIGKCLLDKLMGLLDPEYIERGGYAVEGEELEGVGPSRLIQNIIVNLPYDADKPARLEWVSNWLTNWAGFEQAGDLKKVGLKDRKDVNLAIFQRTTGANIDASNQPITMKEYPK